MAANDLKEAAAEYGVDATAISAVTGEGIDGLLRVLFDMVEEVSKEQ